MTKICMYFLASLAAVLSLAEVSARQPEGDLQRFSEKQAMLIGYSKFNDSNIANLEGVELDLQTINRVLLMNHYDVLRHVPGKGLLVEGTETEPLVVKTDPGVHDDFSTEEADLLKSSIRLFLKTVPGTTETAVIYISTHGVVTNDGLFFVVADTPCPGKSTTRDDWVCVHEGLLGLSYNWLFNEVANCPFDVVLLFDCCHGGEGNVPDLSQYIKRTQAAGNRVVILARCRRDQEASISNCYSRWLALGMQGFADMHPTDGVVDVNELHDFVRQRYQVGATREEPMKFVLGGAQNPALTMTCPQSQDNLMLAMAREIDHVLRNADRQVLDTSEQQGKRICVFVPEFLATPYAQQHGDHFETTRKLLARTLAEYLTRLSSDSNYRVVTLGDVRQEMASEEFSRSTLHRFSHLANAPFVWINGTVEPFSQEKLDPALRSNAFCVLAKHERSTLHIACSLHRKERSIPLTQWSGLMNYVVLNQDDRVEAYPVSIAPQILEGMDSADPATFEAIIMEDAENPVRRQNPLRNELLEPVIMVKNPGAPPTKDDYTAAEFSSYISRNYTKRPLTVTQNNELRVNLKDGEEFIIALKVHPCPSDIDAKPDPADNKPYLFARVLIDGRNTLAQAVFNDESLTLPDDHEIVFRTAEHTLVRNAEPWYIAFDGTTAVIPGFTSRQKPFPRAFRMDDKAVRDRNGKTISDYTGLIQIVVYLPEKPGRHRGVVMPGDPVPYRVQLIDTPYIPGKQIGTWTIQYGNDASESR